MKFTEEMTQMSDIVLVPLSYLYYYHEESKNNPHYTTEEAIRKQHQILAVLSKKGGVGMDEEVAVKRKDMAYFRLN